jgi:hypothetical protein
MSTRPTLLALALLVACGGNTVPLREPTIAFDKAMYIVTLNPGATAVLSKPTPTITVTRGTNPIGPVLFLYLAPADYCNVGAGVGFPYGSAQQSIQGSEAMVSQIAEFNVCPSITGGRTIPKGDTVIGVSYLQDENIYSATSVVRVQ